MTKSNIVSFAETAKKACGLSRRGLALFLALVLLLAAIPAVSLFGAAAEVSEVNDLIGQIPATVTEADAVVINKAMKLYNELTDTSGVTDVDKLTMAYATLNTLIKSGYTALDAWTGTNNNAACTVTTGDTGLTVDFKRGNTSPTARQCFSGQPTLDGLRIKFNNFFPTASDANVAGFGFGFSTWIPADFYNNNTPGFLLYINTVAGKMIMNVPKATVPDHYYEVISGSDVLKQASLAYNSGTITILATEDADNPWQVTVKLADGQEVSGLIPAKYDLSGAVDANGKTFLSVIGGYCNSKAMVDNVNYSSIQDGKNYSRVTIVGSTNVKGVQEMQEQIAALPDTITKQDAVAVNKARAAFDALSVDEQAQVSNAADLESAWEDLLKVLGAGYISWVREYDFAQDYWKANNTRQFESWGMRLDFQRTSLTPAYRAGVAKAVPFDGLQLGFNNFCVTNAAATDAGFGIQFSKEQQADFTLSKSALLLFLDAKNHQIIVNAGGDTSYGVLAANSSVLTVEKLSRNAFTVSVSATGNAATPYAITIALATGESETVNIPAAYIVSDAIFADATAGTTYLTFTAGRFDTNDGFTGTLYNRLDVLGYMDAPAFQAKVAPVISRIAALPDTVQLSDQTAIEAAVSAYESLRQSYYKELVSNYSKLEKAIADLYALWDAANINPYTGSTYTSAGVAPQTITSYAQSTEVINNAALMPAYVTDDQVTVTANGTPDWVDQLVMMACRIETATPEGTFQSAVKVLDHCQEMGVNGLWITPVNDKGTTGNGYMNLGPATIDPRLTGAIGYDEEWRLTDYEAGWQVFAEFVEEAHKRNIRVFLDVVSWGTLKDSTLFTDHPDWYAGGTFGSDTNTRLWDNPNAELQEYFISTVVDIVKKTDVDGLRYDMEPKEAFGFGAAVDAEIRSRLLADGIKIAAFSESPNERGTAYDFEQWGVLGSESVPSQNPQNLFVNGYNMVDSIKNGYYMGQYVSEGRGEYTYYTMMLSCHDFFHYAVEGNEILMGYQAMYAPFIPLWYLGEEWNNTQETETGMSSLLFGSTIHWEELEEPEHRAFFESVKQMIRIRRTYGSLFEQWSTNHRESNICEVKVVGQDNSVSYARYADKQAMVIIPNDNLHDYRASYTVYLPLEEMGLAGYGSYTVTDALSGRQVLSGNEATVRRFLTNVEHGKMALFLVEAVGERIDEGYTDFIARVPNAADASWDKNPNGLTGATQMDNGSWLVSIDRNLNPTRRHTYTNKPMLANLEVKFNNLQAMEGATNTAPGIGLAFSQWANADFTNSTNFFDKGFLLYIDAASGSLIYNAPKSATDKGYKKLVADNSLLTMANLANTAFTVTLKLVPESLKSECTVIISLADGRSVTAELPREDISCGLMADGTTYVSLVTGYYDENNAVPAGNNGCQVEVVGYKTNHLDALGAQLRKDDAVGDTTALRFGMVVESVGLSRDEATYEAILTNATVNVNGVSCPIVTMGTLLGRAVKIAPSDLQLNSTNEHVVDCPAKKIYAIHDQYTLFTAVVENIPSHKREEQIYSRAYVVYKDANGAEHVLYGHVLTRSVSDLSNN